MIGEDLRLRKPQSSCVTSSIVTTCDPVVHNNFHQDTDLGLLSGHLGFPSGFPCPFHCLPRTVRGNREQEGNKEVLLAPRVPREAECQAES
jgi:hypothetical protein